LTDSRLGLIDYWRWDR